MRARLPILLMLVVATAWLWAGPLAAQEPLRVGYVDMEYLINNAPQTRQGREKLEEEFKERNEEILQLEQRLEDLRSKLLRDAEIMTDGEREDLELLIRTLTRDIRRYKDEYAEDFSLRLNEEQNLLIKRVDDAVQTLARTERLDIVLPDTSVIFASQRVDITEKVLERLRLEFQNEEAAGGAAE